jgi:hypothetical protein
MLQRSRVASGTGGRFCRRDGSHAFAGFLFQPDRRVSLQVGAASGARHDVLAKIAAQKLPGAEALELLDVPELVHQRPRPAAERLEIQSAARRERKTFIPSTKASARRRVAAMRASAPPRSRAR